MINPEDLDDRSGNLASKGAGYEITVRELITIMIQESDNTAMKILVTRFITEDDYIDLIGLVGIFQSSEEVNISPKEYANLFRSLYFSTYLRRTFSELALTILLNTDFNSQLPAGLPSDIQISHKVGMGITKGYYHDCGIVYVPNDPYLICVMGQNTTQEKADLMISTLSRITYNYVTKNFKEE
jgi:beta-lactamase class A